MNIFHDRSIFNTQRPPHATKVHIESKNDRVAQDGLALNKSVYLYVSQVVPKRPINVFGYVKPNS